MKETGELERGEERKGEERKGGEDFSFKCGGGRGFKLISNFVLRSGLHRMGFYEALLFDGGESGKLASTEIILVSNPPN